MTQFDVATKLVIEYMAMMKKMGRAEISEGEIFQFLGLPVEDIPDGAFENFYTITDLGMKEYAKGLN